jgi:hypothetical protein
MFSPIVLRAKIKMSKTKLKINRKKLMMAVLLLVAACGSLPDSAEVANVKARADLSAAWRKETAPTKKLFIHGPRPGQVDLHELPAACKDSALLPQSIFPAKSRYTYLAMCDKKPAFLARIERSDGSDEINIIFWPSDDHCRRYPERCTEAALAKPNHIYER